MLWSLHVIAAELCRSGTLRRGLRVCAETIHRACYDRTGGSGLLEGCWRELPGRCRCRESRGRAVKRLGALSEVRGIAERSPAAGGRSESGHWEGDLIIGERNRTAVVTLVERTSRFTLLAVLPGGYTEWLLSGSGTGTYWLCCPGGTQPTPPPTPLPTLWGECHSIWPRP